MPSPFYIGFRRGWWQANAIGLPPFIVLCICKQYYGLAGASIALLVVVFWTWSWAVPKA